MSAARHHGLWTLDDGRFHLSAPPHAGRLTPGDATAHWNRGPVPRDRDSLVEPVADALWHLADCRPFEAALATWESAVRRGTSIAVLARLPMQTPAIRKLLIAATALSDSGIESIPVARLARIGILVAQQVVIDGRPVDGLIGDRLVLQIDGYRFHRTPEQRGRDIEADRRLQLMGYTVFRLDYHDVLADWDRVELEIRMALAQGLHRSGADSRDGRSPGANPTSPRANLLRL
ncbi:endonuclease domain-containing protein [Agromyces sp. NPDC058110]|uniref:endonuclease domain-containing protein n=1 Tax=Agromyces sp. NPDC058110 TaxID=3346345 RepID=UPI0036DF1C50